MPAVKMGAKSKKRVNKSTMWLAKGLIAGGSRLFCAGSSLALLTLFDKYINCLNGRVADETVSSKKLQGWQK
jgi:hypothetical protein